MPQKRDESLMRAEVIAKHADEYIRDIAFDDKKCLVALRADKPPLVGGYQVLQPVGETQDEKKRRDIVTRFAQSIAGNINEGVYGSAQFPLQAEVIVKAPDKSKRKSESDNTPDAVLVLKPRKPEKNWRTQAVVLLGDQTGLSPQELATRVQGESVTKSLNTEISKIEERRTPKQAEALLQDIQIKYEPHKKQFKMHVLFCDTYRPPRSGADEMPEPAKPKRPHLARAKAPVEVTNAEGETSEAPVNNPNITNGPIADMRAPSAITLANLQNFAAKLEDKLRATKAVTAADYRTRVLSEEDGKRELIRFHGDWLPDVEVDVTAPIKRGVPAPQNGIEISCGEGMCPSSEAAVAACKKLFSSLAECAGMPPKELAKRVHLRPTPLAITAADLGYPDTQPQGPKTAILDAARAQKEKAGK